MQKYIIVLLLSFALIACADTSNKKPIVSVTIAPLASIVEQIADTTLQIEVIVPETTSPETYEMTARQMIDISDSDIIFAIGLIDFEQVLSSKIVELSPESEYINLSEGIPLLDGQCNDPSHNHGHLHDPHIWLSLKRMRMIVSRINVILCEYQPQNRNFYTKNTTILLQEIDSLDTELKNKFAQCTNKSFAIVHPSLSYFADDYGLNQMSIENNGKEPSTSQLKTLIDSFRELQIKQILYSRQTPNQAAIQIAEEINAQTKEYDPMRRDFLMNIAELSTMLCD